MDSRKNVLTTPASAFIGVMILFSWVSISGCSEMSTTRDLERNEGSAPLHYLIAGIPTILAIQVATLRRLGQPWISKSGEVLLWTGDTYGPDNSQHLTDWYTFDHVLHGFILHYLTGFVSSEDIQLRFLLAVTAESLWEMLENSPVILDRYSMVTATAPDYSGDSIINSLSDNAAMAVGFWMAHFLPIQVITALAVAEEIVLAYNIRDNLILNILQFIAPNKVISEWQSELIQSNKTKQ